ncbi:hypothetical protein D3C81_1777740 [compost metagenome]
MYFQMMNGLFNSGYMDVLEYMHMTPIQFMQNTSTEPDRVNFSIAVSDQGSRFREGIIREQVVLGPVIDTWDRSLAK